LHALLTEAELIQTHQPPYNILSKDDKSPLYLIITPEDFPRLLPIRKKTLLTTYQDLPRSNIFGPFQSGLSARRILKLSRRVFKFCTASPTQKAHHQACFYTHIGLCLGACTGQVSREEYQRMITHLKLFLKGQDKTLLKSLKKQMKQSSQDHQFEQAATIRDQIQAIEHLYLLKGPLAYDQKLPILSTDIGYNRLDALRRLLHQVGFVGSTYPLGRIECYDISNTSGVLSTASMVVFIHGAPDTSEYRHFRIKYTSGPNDPAMILEAVARRLNHPEWSYPNLIVIDGGKTQLKAALSVFSNASTPNPLPTIPTVSIAKHPDRLLIPKIDPQSKNINFTYIKLVPGEPASNLIEHLRDESHRFAKAYHTKLRTQHQTIS